MSRCFFFISKAKGNWISNFSMVNEIKSAIMNGGGSRQFICQSKNLKLSNSNDPISNKNQNNVRRNRMPTDWKTGIGINII